MAEDKPSRIDRTQTAVLVGVILFFVVGIGIAAYLSQQGQRNQRNFGPDPAKRFKAREGTTRDNAVMLVSSKKPGGADALSQEDPGNPPGGPPPRVEYLGPPGGDTPVDPVALEAQAQAASTPEESIRLIEAAIAVEGTAQDELARLYALLAAFEARKPGVEPADVVERFAQAWVTAAAPAAREEIALRELDTLSRQGDPPEQVIAHLAAAAKEATPGSANALRIAVGLGDLLLARDDAPAAEKAYGAALETAFTTSDTAAPGWVDTFRLAGLRLARLYRTQGRNEEADQLGLRMQSRLNALTR